MIATAPAVLASPRPVDRVMTKLEPEPGKEGKTFYVVTAVIGFSMFVLCGISIMCLLAVVRNSA